MRRLDVRVRAMAGPLSIFLAGAILAGCGQGSEKADTVPLDVGTAPAATPRPVPTAVPDQPLLEIPAALRHRVAFPEGATEVRDIKADGPWALFDFFSPDQPNGRQDQLWALDIDEGRALLLDEHGGQGAVSANRAAWVEAICTYTAEPAVGGKGAECTGWRIHLADLVKGDRHLVRSGDVVDEIYTPMFEYSGEFILPRVALSPDTLAYTSGDIRHGFVLHLLPLAGGAERAIKLGGPVDQIEWTGMGFAWIENAGLHSDGLSKGMGSPHYYSANRVMVLPLNSTAARELGSGAMYLAAGGGGAAWVASEPTDEWGDVPSWRANHPDWVTAPLAPDSGVDTVALSGDWVGWTLHSLPDLDHWLVLRPQDSAPVLIRGCAGMSGGLLFLVDRAPDTFAITGFWAVRIADIPLG